MEDENGNSLFGVTVINQTKNLGASSDINGLFQISAQTGDLLKLSYIGKKTKFYKVKPTDSLFVFVKLETDLTQLKEFAVDGKRIKKVSAEDNDNILDYYSLGKNTLLVLKSAGRDYQVTIEGIDTVYKTFPIIGFKPRSLFLDVFGNYHLVSKDSVRQIYFDQGFSVISTVTEVVFKTKIEPHIYVKLGNIISYKFSNHNKKYVVSSLQNRKTNKILEIYSEEGEMVAVDVQNAIIRLYSHLIHPSQNIILNKTWDGNLVSLLNNIGDDASLRLNRAMFELISWYKNVRGKEIKVQTFSINNSLLTFEFLNDSLIAQNTNGDILKKTKLTILNKGFTKEVVLDREQNTFYAYSLNSGLVTLDKIDLQSGKTIDSYELKGVTFPKKLKVIDGWAYFINPNKNGYHKLYRIELDN